MDGAALAAERQFKRDLSLAWHTAAFSSAAQAGKLKKLSSYQKEPQRVQSADQMLGTLQMLKDMGASMTIRQVN
jgi:hypothetical protein